MKILMVANLIASACLVILGVTCIVAIWLLGRRSVGDIPPDARPIAVEWIPSESGGVAITPDLLDQPIAALFGGTDAQADRFVSGVVPAVGDVEADAASPEESAAGDDGDLCERGDDDRRARPDAVAVAERPGVGTGRDDCRRGELTRKESTDATGMLDAFGRVDVGGAGGVGAGPVGLAMGFTPSIVGPVLEVGPLDSGEVPAGRRGFESYAGQ